MGDPTVSPIAEAMNRLWAKHLPQMEERIATLRFASERLARGALTEDEQQRAAAEAHKLAGVLGTFGLTDGTELAREAEGMYSSSLGSDSTAVMRLSVIAERLKALVASRSRVP